MVSRVEGEASEHSQVTESEENIHLFIVASP